MGPDYASPQRFASRQELRQAAFPLPTALEDVTEDEGQLDAAVRLLERALHLAQNGERAPGGDETWGPLWTDVEVFLRGLDRQRILDRLWVARCELSPEVVREMDSEALAAHLRDAHPAES